jgi:hypothetical protein
VTWWRYFVFKGFSSRGMQPGGGAMEACKWSSVRLLALLKNVHEHPVDSADSTKENPIIVVPAARKAWQFAGCS